MTDAISRSDLLRNLGKRIHAERKRLLKDALLDFSSAIINAPALDVAPVVHARWIMNHFGAKCSNCLRLYCMEPSWSEKIKHMPPTWIYCPNCGAKMDEEVSCDPD